MRAAVIDAFNTNAKVTVFLISLKAGGQALNLTAVCDKHLINNSEVIMLQASHVFLMDPWWNPAVEAQVG